MSCSSTQTVTDVTYYVSYDTNGSGSPTASTTTSTFSTVVEACSGIAATTSTSRVTGSCTSCLVCGFPTPTSTVNEPDPALDDDDDEEDDCTDDVDCSAPAGTTADPITDYPDDPSYDDGTGEDDAVATNSTKRSTTAQSFRQLSRRARRKRIQPLGGSANLPPVSYPAYPAATVGVLRRETANLLPASLAVLPRYHIATTIGCKITTTALNAASAAAQTVGAYRWQNAALDPKVARANTQFDLDHACKFDLKRVLESD